MSPPFAESPYSSIVDHWEAAGTRLEESFSAYMKSTLVLSTCLPESRSAAKDLVSRIDHKFASLYASLDEQLSKSRWTLTRTRNKLISSSYTIPEEVLSQIFILVVFDRDNRHLLHMEDDVRALYKRLYSLMGVCSLWRKVGMSRGIFWSLVPMISRTSGWFMQQPAEISLQRAQARGLHLMASIEARSGVPSFFTDAMKQHADRFCTINLTADARRWLNVVLSSVLDRAAPECLKELSLCYDPPLFEVPHPPAGSHDYFTPYNPSKQHKMNTLFQTLRVLRVRNVHIHWQHVSLTQLVELRIDSIMLGFNSDLYQFILSLTSAPQLRKLQITSVVTLPDPTDMDFAPLAFPNLQSLALEDLYWDAIWIVLASIIPGQHQVAVYATDKSLCENTPTEIAWGGIDFLIWAIQGTRVDTLMLRGSEIDRNWVDSDGLRRLLSTLPSLTCLKFHGWDFRLSDWVALSRSEALFDFPRLQHVEITGSGFYHTKAIQDIVLSHSVQKMLIGGSVTQGIPPKSEPDEWKPLMRSDDIVKWLEARVPDFELVDEYYEPPEFQIGQWTLY